MQIRLPRETDDITNSFVKVPETIISERELSIDLDYNSPGVNGFVVSCPFMKQITMSELACDGNTQIWLRDPRAHSLS